MITEGVPVQDTAEVVAYLEGKSTRMIGPNCPGIITPEESLAGITPHTIAGKGPVGLVSKSGTLTYQMMYELKDYGFTTAIGIGGDPIVGTTHIDALEAFENDPETKAIVMIGEIGGDAEERAAAYIKDHVTKPVVGYVAGFTAPEGKTMGHAGAIVSGSSGTAAGEEGGPRGRRRQGRQDAVRDRRADAGDPAGPLIHSTNSGRQSTFQTASQVHLRGRHGIRVHLSCRVGGLASHSTRHTTWAPSRRTGATDGQRRGERQRRAGRAGQRRWNGHASSNLLP